MRRLFLYTSMILTVMLLCGCVIKNQTGTGTLTGTISIGPICPVERDPPDPNCKPTAETFAAYPVAVYQDDEKIASIEPALDGSYSVELRPGTYTVDLEKKMGLGGGGLPQTMTLAKGDTAVFDINIDTGIR